MYKCIYNDDADLKKDDISALVNYIVHFYATLFKKYAQNFKYIPEKN